MHCLNVCRGSLPSEVRPAYPSGTVEVTLGFLWGLYCSIFSFLCDVCRTLSILNLSFNQCIVCPSLIYAFWLPL